MPLLSIVLFIYLQGNAWYARHGFMSDSAAWPAMGGVDSEPDLLLGTLSNEKIFAGIS